MILSILLILTVSLVLLCLMLKRIVVHPVIAKMLGVCLIEFSVLLYVVKFSNYSFITKADTFIYMKLAALELSVPQISLIMNWGVALLLASGALLVQIYLKKKYLSVLFLPVLIFLAINNPTICEMAYIAVHKGKIDLSIDAAIKLHKVINIAFVLVYAVIPYIMYIVKYLNTRLYYKKKNYVFSLLILFLMDLLIYSSIMFSSLKNYFLFNLDLLKYPMSVQKLTGNGLTLFFTAFVAVSVLLAIIILRPMGSFASGLKETVIAGKMNRTVSMLLHSYKNAFVAIEMFADDKNGAFLGSEEKRLQRIREIAFEHEEKIKEIINVINAQNNLSLIMDNVSLNAVIEDAMGEMHKDGSASIVFNPTADYIIEADEYHLRESILCLLNNANEALAEKTDEKKITVITGNDEKDIYIEVIDNGCGMENTKTVFNPLYSSKMGVKNFGIGLTYVKAIIEAHNGTVEIKSKVNEGTIVQLALKNAIKANNKGCNLNE